MWSFIFHKKHADVQKSYITYPDLPMELLAEKELEPYSLDSLFYVFLIHSQLNAAMLIRYLCKSHSAILCRGNWMKHGPDPQETYNLSTAIK